MNKMPYEIKQKIRQYNEAVLKASQLSAELDTMIEKYGVPIDNLLALTDVFSNEPSTEALAYIHNGECATEESLMDAIVEIEEIFLHFVNRSER